MAFESDLTTFVEADAGVVALVSSRVYPLRLPQVPTFPAIVYQVVSTVVMDHHHGSAGRLLRARVQFTLWAGSHAGADALARALRAALDGYAGTMTSTVVGYALMQTERADWDATTEDYRRIQDYYILYVEAV
jgi:hypothetical protein